MAESSKLSLKLFVHTKQQKVIFAEAGQSAIDFLFHLLTLPLGTIIRLISKEKMAGSFGNLFESIQNLEETYIQCGETKDVFLKPTLSVLNAAVSKGPLFSLPDALCPHCQKTMSRQMVLVPSQARGGSGGGGFVKGLMMYMVMDDLVVKPMSAASFVEVCNKFNVFDVGELVEKQVDLGSDEALSLLEASLVSSNVLTTVFLKKMVRNVELSCEENSNRTKYKSLS